MVVLEWFKNRILKVKNTMPGFSSYTSCSKAEEDNEDYCSNHYYFPDDVLIEILSRVPADCLEVFKRVCHHWRLLILSYDFLKLHMKRAKEEAINNPLIFVEYTSYSERRAIWLRYGRSVEYWLHLGIIWKQCDGTSNLIGSCDGLLMFRIEGKPYSKSLIVNPITQETRLITNPHDVDNEYTCCIFFDRFEDDYKVLHIYPGRTDMLYDDYIYSFRRQIWERIHQVKTHHLFVPGRDAPPAILADALHWTGDCENPCSKRVLVFKIETKEFSYLPHPTAIRTDININDNCCLSTDDGEEIHSDESMQLIERNGQLCLCHTIISSKVIDIWILEDYDNFQSWMRKFKIDLLMVGKNYGGSRHIDWYYDELFMKPIDIVSFKNDDILLAWEYRGLYLYDLKTNKINLIIDDLYGSYAFAPFTKTLLSPSDVCNTLS